MKLFFAVSLILLFLSACASQDQREASIDINAIEAGDTSLLETYKNDPYIISSKQAKPGYIEFSNAMESAIYKRNIEAVRYLISINAAHKVSVRYYNIDGYWARTPVNVPAAELACGVAAFDIMELLLESYPEDKPNYTNCLHYLIASFDYYPSGHFFMLHNTIPEWRNGENTAIAAQKIMALGGAPNALPEYGSTLHSMIFRTFTNKLLVTLLEQGMDPNNPYSCTVSGHCLILADLGNYIDEDLSSERAKLLVQYGADVNAITETPVINASDARGVFQFKNQSMTALHIARFFNRDKLAETLIELGADPTLTNDEGKTAENYAGAFAEIKATQTQQAAASQQAATANTNQDSGGSGLGTLMNIIGAVGAGAW